MLSAPVGKWVYSHHKNSLFLFPKPPPSSGCRGPHCEHTASSVVQTSAGTRRGHHRAGIMIVTIAINRGKVVIREAKGHKYLNDQQG